MLLDEIIVGLEDVVDPHAQEYIQIIYGNAWEFQFWVDKKVVITEVIRHVSFGLSAYRFMKKVQEYKGIEEPSDDDPLEGTEVNPI